MDEELLAPVDRNRPDAHAIAPAMPASPEQRELERARRAEAARVAALVQYMLHDRPGAARPGAPRH
jgi:hypothetical protein